MLDNSFLNEFKRSTETKWKVQAIDRTVYGFQFQCGTRWNPGLSQPAIAEYENVLGVRLPLDVKAFLGKMNGTDLPTLNVYGSSGYPTREWVGAYSYPRDLNIIRERMDDVARNLDEIRADLADQGFDLASDAGLIPIFGHRYVVCARDPTSSVVLSIVVDDTDAIVYANSLKEYLQKEFLSHP